MADSTCLIQHPFSYTSGFPNESMEGNHPIHALGQSVSFGRFMSESLAWDKWSTFSHNRYVEEAEKFSRPGSVAQKKAFFEAHYKKIAAQRAAALLEQENAAASSNSVQQTETVDDVGACAPLQPAMPSSAGVEQHGSCDGSDLKEEKVGSREVEGADSGIAHQVFDEIPQKVEPKIKVEGVDLNGGLTEVELIRTPQMEKSLPKSSRQNLEHPSTISKKKAATSYPKLPLFNRSSKIPSTPAKPIAPASTPKQVANKHVMESADKRKSTPKSLRMAVNFTPIRELNKLTSTVIRKIERSRVGSNTSKPAKDCSTPLRTPNTALKNVPHKHPSTTPWSEKKRNKSYSPFSFTPFSLRTEERAARRKEKLEEKFNTNESQKKVQLQTKLKEKTETEVIKLHQSSCFKARPLPNFYRERKAQMNNEVPKTHTPSPKVGRKISPRTGETTMPHSGYMPPVKSSRSMNKSVQGKARSPSLRTLMSAHENTSPNIQQ
ncbi:protein WVD2-like 7 isoform X2 [Cucurbita pepo subsp. pepo]|uniref:protein WVD2-like 7 isoform X2 n=1 Tax=Cucurbita pepo subsp. pepo TaxID=3664 RepID=UPI000C9D545B|nr:protein WVD2-like 7 isoform X2 [Cucurbita pepo subsp. pepo]